MLAGEKEKQHMARGMKSAGVGKGFSFFNYVDRLGFIEKVRPEQ